MTKQIRTAVTDEDRGELDFLTGKVEDCLSTWAYTQFSHEDYMAVRDPLMAALMALGDLRRRPDKVASEPVRSTKEATT